MRTFAALSNVTVAEYQFQSSILIIAFNQSNITFCNYLRTYVYLATHPPTHTSTSLPTYLLYGSSHYYITNWVLYYITTQCYNLQHAQVASAGGL